MCPSLWALLRGTHLLHHGLRNGPKLRCLLKLLLLHGVLHRLCCFADICQAVIIQQRLHSKRGPGGRSSITMQYDYHKKTKKNILPDVCYLQWCRGTVPRSWRSLWGSTIQWSSSWNFKPSLSALRSQWTRKFAEGHISHTLFQLSNSHYCTHWEILNSGQSSTVYLTRVMYFWKPRHCAVYFNGPELF